MGLWKKQRPRNKNFVLLPGDVLESRAYIALPHLAARALPYFLRTARFNPQDLDSYTRIISIPYSEARRYGFPPASWAKAIRELVAKGFLDPQIKGGISEFRRRNQFTLSRRWINFGHKNFVEIDWKTFQKGLPKAFG